MATSSDLESYFNIILTAEKGESVRDAIINASNTLKKMTKNAGSLEGYDPDYFATATRYLTLYDEILGKFRFDDIDDLSDSSYSFQSEGIVNCGTLYAYLMKYLRPSFKVIARYQNDPNIDKETMEAVKTYLATLNKVKTDIGKAITAKGKTVKNAKDFREYADLIRHIGDEIPNIVDNANLTQNKVYEAATEQGSTLPHAYSSFTVNLDKSKLLEKGSGDVNGQTYTPSEGKLFSSFDVNVKTRSGSAAATRATNVKRGKTADGSESNLDENGLIKSFDISENGPYDALEYAAEGFASLNVHVTEPKVEGKEFTVTFMNGGDILGDPVKVPAYGDAYYEGPTPVSPDDPNKVFSGWVPAPVRVIQDLECQAYFKDPKPATPGEIEDSWEEIIRNRGANYDFGQYKSLNLGTINGHNYGNLIFEKVYSGESSSTSTWLSKTTVANVFGSVDMWPISAARTFLHTTFKEDLSYIDDGALIAKAVVPVVKHTITNWPGIVFNGCENFMYCTTADEFWIPSMGEMWGWATNGEKTLQEVLQECWEHYYSTHGASWQEPYAPSRVTFEGFAGRPIVSYGQGRTDAEFVVQEDADRWNPHLVLNSQDDADWAIKYRSTATSTPAAYTLRTLANWGYPTGAVYHTPNYWGIYGNGQPPDWGEYSNIGYWGSPIGFCL